MDTAKSINVIDASCDCDRCTSRTNEFYEIDGGCNNCGATFRVRNRRGDKTPLSVECPTCGVNVYAWTRLR